MYKGCSVQCCIVSLKSKILCILDRAGGTRRGSDNSPIVCPFLMQFLLPIYSFIPEISRPKYRYVNQRGICSCYGTSYATDPQTPHKEHVHCRNYTSVEQRRVTVKESNQINVCGWHLKTIAFAIPFLPSILISELLFPQCTFNVTVLLKLLKLKQGKKYAAQLSFHTFECLLFLVHCILQTYIQFLYQVNRRFLRWIVWGRDTQVSDNINTQVNLTISAWISLIKAMRSGGSMSPFKHSLQKRRVQVEVSPEEVQWQYSCTQVHRVIALGWYIGVLSSLEMSCVTQSVMVSLLLIL